MNKKENFFKELRQHLTRDQQTERFIHELKDHLEDKEKDEALSQKSFHKINPYDLGEPKKLASFYKRSAFMNKISYFLAVIVFCFTFYSVVMATLENNYLGYSSNLFTAIGIILIIFALPVTFFMAVLQGFILYLSNYNLMGLNIFHSGLYPFLIASYYTFLYFVFFCKPFWHRKKPHAVE